MDDEKEIKLDSLVDDVINEMDNDGLNVRQYSKLESAVKEHNWYDLDDYEVEIGDIDMYVNHFCDDDEKKIIASWCGYGGLPFKNETLDDEYKLEILGKLFKMCGTSLELEAALGTELNNKIKNTIL